MTLTITYHEPAALVRSAESEMEAIPFVELFNDSKYQKLRERWCAALFGVGYSKFIRPCQVAVNDGPTRLDVDFSLHTSAGDWDFQLAEIQEPGRRRGLEFKQFADGTVRTIAYDAERGKRDGRTWLTEAVSRKKAKRYASSDALQLLLYANFPAQDLQYADVATALSQFRDDFASIWVMTSLHLCSTHSPPHLGGIHGWGVVRSIEDYYA
jgi:hypothetical protein